MKKIITALALSALAASFCQAAPVGRSKAAAKAAEFLGIEQSRARQVLSGRNAINAAAQGSPAYYIFNRDGGGYVIVSGEDCLIPVLGYSESGHIDADRIPANMQFWLDRVGKTAAFFSKHSLPVREDIAEMWKSSAAPGEAGGKLLELPTWSQEHPYNWYCPYLSKYEEGRAVTGCVATACAMVMRYYQWPPCGTGVLPDYDMRFWPDAESDNYITIKIHGHELGHEYKWSIMPMEDIYSETVSTPSEAHKQVAWLMYDLGIMLKATYSYDGTGAYTEDIPGRISKYMYYKNTSKIIYKNNYSTSEWLSAVKKEIDEDRPVIYGGTSGDGGHQFLVCGYDSDDKLYVNWGWGGACNGYFNVDNFAPYADQDLSYLLEYGYTQAEIDELKADKFDTDIDALIGLEPDRSTTPAPVQMDEPAQYSPQASDYPSDSVSGSDLYLKAGTHKGHPYYGITRNDGTVSRISKGDTFLLNAGLIQNPTTKKYTGYFRFDQVDFSGKYIGTLGSRSSSAYVDKKAYYYVYDISCTARDEVRLGDKVQLYTSKSQNGDYQLVGWEEGWETVGEMPMIPLPIHGGGTEVLNAGGIVSGVSEVAGTPGMLRVEYKDGTVELLVQE